MSLDPKVETTLQPYQYVGNDPLNGKDPTGLGGGGICDNTNAKKQAACLKGLKAQAAAANKALNCPSGYFNSSGKCDPSLANQTYNPPALPMQIIEVAAAAIGCIPGAVACAVAGVTVTAVKVGSDIQNHCSGSSTAADALLGIAGSAASGVFRLGAEGVENLLIFERWIYNSTTDVPSAVQPFVNPC